MDFLVHNLSYLVEPEIVVSDYFRARLILIFLIFLNLTFEILLTIWVLNIEESLLSQLTEIYIFLPIDEFRSALEIGTISSSVINLFIYVYAMCAVCSHKVTTIQNFLRFLMFSIFMSICLTYINA